MIALLRNESSSDATIKTITRGSLLCRYIGKGVIERIRINEFAHATPTITYTGADYTVVEAMGELSVSDLCIT
jgi:hypothetical protein